ncbi:MAG: hypothetical protein ABJA78_18740 [Ferruginibacter sp.]
MIRFIFMSLCMLAGYAGTSQTIGSKVSFKAVDGKNYTGTIKEVRSNQFRVRYDAVDFEAWLTASQFQLLQNTTVSVINTNQPSATVATGVQMIFDFGKNMGWANAMTERRFNAYFTPLTEDQKATLLTFLNRAKTNSARFFVLKSWLANDNFNVLQGFIDQLNQYPEAYQQEHCLVSTQHSIIQQWEFSCSVTVVQTYLGDLCPRYAWEVKQVSNYDVAAQDPYTNPMGQQQKELLEKYGGAASVRGDLSGKSIPINDALNELVGKMLGIQFNTQQVTEPLTIVFPKIRAEVDKGLNVPLLIGFVGSQARHFILLMNYKYMQGDYQYLIYDPWDGRCGYVSETGFKQGSLSPLLTQWKISLDYYYTAL